MHISDVILALDEYAFAVFSHSPSDTKSCTRSYEEEDTDSQPATLFR